MIRCELSCRVSRPGPLESLEPSELGPGPAVAHRWQKALSSGEQMVGDMKETQRVKGANDKRPDYVATVKKWRSAVHLEGDTATVPPPGMPPHGVRPPAYASLDWHFEAAKNGRLAKPLLQYSERNCKGNAFRKQKEGLRIAVAESMPP